MAPEEVGGNDIQRTYRRAALRQEDGKFLNVTGRNKEEMKVLVG